MSPEEIISAALERYERPLIAYAKTFTGDLDAARDAVQETFLRLSRQDVKALEKRLAPWLFLVCRNCALDHQRKIVRFVPEGLDHDPADSAPAPDAAASEAEDHSHLRSLLDGLPEKQRELVVLKFEAGLSYQEISEATRLSVSNVGYQLHHAIRTLRERWNQPPTEALP